ncbi:unnamed protein product [Lampetra fluviatilis]
MLEKFLQRWNNTYTLWGAGIMDTSTSSNVVSYQTFNEQSKILIGEIISAKEAGYNSIAEQFQAAFDAYVEQSKEKPGVCAVVRIRIEQKLTLTREAIKATLDITNQEVALLDGINVTITIKRHDNKSQSNHLFSIGNPKLTGGLTGVSGEGSLQTASSGSAEWLMVAYSAAAPTTDTLYDVSGVFSYGLGGSLVEVPLYPETITIAPDPRLIVHYFLESFVNSDDPFTDAVEPPVPFTLAVVIRNKGYGMARQLEITSSQPEIASNKKGLLVKFQIIGASLGSEPMSSSLQVRFGDLQPFETRVARWWMTSSLLGEFKNYSATFQNKNPLGDPRLSLLDELKIHKLVRNVRIAGDGDDGLLDFLVTDSLSSGIAYPDRLYDSKDLRYADVTTAERPELSKNVILSDVVDNLRRMKLVECQEHKEPLKFLCQTDESLICVVCTLMEGHRGHDAVTVQEGHEARKIQVGEEARVMLQKSTEAEATVRRMEAARRDVQTSRRTNLRHQRLPAAQLCLPLCQERSRTPMRCRGCRLRAHGTGCTWSGRGFATNQRW